VRTIQRIQTGKEPDILRVIAQTLKVKGKELVINVGRTINRQYSQIK
jgi:hypothetical protein